MSGKLVSSLKQRAFPLSIPLCTHCSQEHDHVPRIPLIGCAPGIVQEAADLHVVQRVLSRPTQVTGAQHRVPSAFVVCSSSSSP